MLSVVYLGNFQPDLAEADRWSTEHQIALTLEAMGHRVTRAQEIGGPGREWGWDRTIKACRDEQADLFLWTTTTQADWAGAYRAIDELRRQRVPTASFHLDLYWGLARATQLLEHPFWRTDHVFTADGGHQEGFARNGITHHWSPPGVYEPDTYTIGQPRDEHRWPVVFVGSYPYPHPEHADTRRQMILQLQSRYGPRFRHYRGGHRGQALADIYTSATVIIGDSCLAGRSPRYWSDRIPETLGRGGFLVHPHIEGIDDHYTDGAHFRTFEPGDIGQMLSIIEHYLTRPDEAKAIGRAGQEHVRAGHTYRHRMETMLTTLGLADVTRGTLAVR